MDDKRDNTENTKIKGETYRRMHSGDCYLYITHCDNCKQEVGGWTPKEANENWDKHTCNN